MHSGRITILSLIPERELNDTGSTIDRDELKIQEMPSGPYNSIYSIEKTVSFHAFMDDVSPDIVIGIETKLDNTYKNCEIFLPGYRSNVIRRDRSRHGGRVFIVTKDEINITEIYVANTDCPLF